ncbi:unnamed protein product [Lampetra fluviatilis]
MQCGETRSPGGSGLPEVQAPSRRRRHLARCRFTPLDGTGRDGGGRGFSVSFNATRGVRVWAIGRRGPEAAAAAWAEIAARVLLVSSSCLSMDGTSLSGST